MPIVIVSGGLDPIHSGHIRLIQAAAPLGRVLVLLHSDAWLIRKKGYTFMPYAERAEVLANIQGVWQVWAAADQDDGGVDATLRTVRDVYPDEPLVFANGGDRLRAPEAEERACQETGIILAYNVGGGKVQASSKLIAAVRGVQSSGASAAVLRHAPTSRRHRR